VPAATGIEVVDASALAALLFGEPDAALVAERLGAGRLVAPALLDFELANICLTKLRRHPAQREAILRGFALRGRMAIDLVAVDQREVVATAESTGLTAYDASYLWLARRLGAGLVTLDRQLATAHA
jgi:predicted nucleic acid-binding protein